MKNKNLKNFEDFITNEHFFPNVDGVNNVKDNDNIKKYYPIEFYKKLPKLQKSILDDVMDGNNQKILEIVKKIDSLLVGKWDDTNLFFNKVSRIKNSKQFLDEIKDFYIYLLES